MRRLLIGAPLLLFLVGPAPGETDPAGGKPPHRERIAWCDIWFTGANQDALPRVWLIGGSIARGCPSFPNLLFCPRSGRASATTVRSPEQHPTRGGSQPPAASWLHGRDSSSSPRKLA
ncbi:MAG: hypothetical protein ACLFTT_16260 [Candidatus Hydrogenedentota bacterium]